MEGDGFNKETGQKLFYDTLVEMNIEYPTNTSSLLTHNERFAPKVVRDWNAGRFAKSKWQVTNYTTNKTYDNLTFSDANEYGKWKDRNVKEDSGFFIENVDLRVYDIVDETIPTFSRMWGYNTMYMSMKGRRRYKFGTDTFYYGKGYINLLAAMWNEAHSGLGGFTAADFNEMDKHRNLFWTTSNYSRLYSMPKSDNAESIIGPYSTSISGRHVYSAAGGLEQVPNDWFSINKVYFAFEDSYESFNIKVGTAHSNTKKIRERVLNGHQGKGVAFYSLYSRTDSSKKAILVKPMGVNVIWLDWFDTSLYDLEVVYFSTDKQQIDFATIDPSEFWRSSPKNGVGIFQETFLKDIKFPGSTFRSAKYNTVPDIYFRLRDKSNNRVGRLSRAKISMHFGSDIYPCNFMVRNGVKSV